MKLNSSLLLASGLLALSLQGAHATVLMTPTVADPANPARDNFTGTVGFRFTVASAGTLGGTGLSVTSLGFQDDNINGLAVSHKVGIWDIGGNLLAQATVAAGSINNSLVGNYRYALSLQDGLGNTITTLTLAAGGQYALGAFVQASSGDAWTGDLDSAQFTINSAATMGVGAFDSVYNATTFAAMNTDGSAGFRWSPGNMQFTVVPEPSAALLGGLGMLALLRRRRR